MEAIQSLKVTQDFAERKGLPFLSMVRIGRVEIKS
jgi:hypothetical protein